MTKPLYARLVEATYRLPEAVEEKVNAQRWYGRCVIRLSKAAALGTAVISSPIGVIEYVAYAVLSKLGLLFWKDFPKMRGEKLRQYTVGSLARAEYQASTFEWLMGKSQYLRLSKHQNRVSAFAVDYAQVLLVSCEENAKEGLIQAFKEKAAVNMPPSVLERWMVAYQKAFPQNSFTNFDHFYRFCETFEEYSLPVGKEQFPLPFSGKIYQRYLCNLHKESCLEILHQGGELEELLEEQDPDALVKMYALAQYKELEKKVTIAHENVFKTAMNFWKLYGWDLERYPMLENESSKSSSCKEHNLHWKVLKIVLWVCKDWRMSFSRESY